ncbi:MAG: PHP domain-containing protein [bacterium]|nr:PHP domain-containing protein [bacterium]
MADFHIHSALSPCGSLEMSPKKIVETALQKGINFIAITDHNAYENSAQLSKFVEKKLISALYGMEVQTSEEVHLLALFDSVEKLKEFGKIVYEHLPNIPNNPDYFGDQVVVDENDEIIKFEEKLLLNSITLSMDEVLSLVKDYGGISVLSHVNATHFSIISQLGFIPENLNVDALEVMYNTEVSKINDKEIPGVSNYPIVMFSDAHYPEEIGRGYVVFNVEKPTVEEIKKALKGLEGRSYEVYGEKGRIL